MFIAYFPGVALEELALFVGVSCGGPAVVAPYKAP